MRAFAKVRLAAVLVSCFAAASAIGVDRYLNGTVWPEPPVVTPGVNNAAPSDAIVLFDGKNFDAWTGVKDGKINDDGSFTSRSELKSKQAFGDIQLHVEWATPTETQGKKGQGRGNNGIGLMDANYEIQILDNFESKTYPEGMAGSVYNQKPPMVNACRKPGEWQSYDIIFTAPVFENDAATKPAHVTVLHNGVLVQNHSEIIGTTFYDQATKYVKHAAKLPIVLMHHGDQVKFRNVWVREIQEPVGTPGPKGPDTKPMPAGKKVESKP